MSGNIWVESTEFIQLEGTVLANFWENGVKVDNQNVKVLHWLKSNNNSKKTIIKLSIRKDANKMCEFKKK